MSYLVWLLIGAVVVYYIISRSKQTHTKSSQRNKPVSSPASHLVAENEDWLEERWELAEKEQASGELKTVPDWFFDPVTDPQTRRLESHGIELTSEKLTKGQASDLIGLFEPPDSDDAEILRHFKVPMRKMNDSKARHLTKKLMSDPANVESFNNRPADQFQREFYRFHGLPVPKGLTATQAIEFIYKKSEELTPEQQKRWDDYEGLWQEMCDPDLKDMYEIKKPSLALFREAVEVAMKEGHNIEQLSDDPQLLVDTLIKLKPEIERED